MSGRPTILFDVSRLEIRATLASPTGIDRVTEAYAAWLLSRPDIELTPVCSWGGVLWPLPRRRMEALIERKAGRPRTMPTEVSSRLYAALAEPRPTAPSLRPRKAGSSKLRASIGRYAPAVLGTLAQWRPRPIPAGAVYLNVSHFGLEQPGLLDRLAARGVRIAVMIHDLIPIEHPEFCSPMAARLHRRRIDSVLERAELVIANSRSTGEALQAFARGQRARCPRICAAPLGLEPAFLASGGPERALRPYFVCVGTLEPRKNLAFLLTLWRRLAERLGDATPPLVLVGQRGWENESIIDHLERSPAILRHVHEASGLDDAQLAQVIANARALLAPSFCEGFDLPVSEAIALGVPVIASDIPVHRELASDAQLIDPLDGKAWLGAIEAAARARPQSGAIRRPCWTDHFTMVAEAMGLDPPPMVANADRQDVSARAAAGARFRRVEAPLDVTSDMQPRDRSCFTNV